MSGSVWMIAMRWSMRLLGLVSTAILARLLTPEDFGLVAMSAIAVGFIEIFSQLGVELALIRHPNPQRRHYDTAWTFNILTGLFLGAVMVLVAPYAVAYFGEPRVEPVLWVLALAPLIKGAVNIGTVDFRKDLQFSKDFQFNFIPRIAAFFTTITLALVFRNYWALVIGTMMHGVYMLIVSFIIHPYRPWFSLQEHRSLLPSSFWVVVKTMGDFVDRQTRPAHRGALDGDRGDRHLLSQCRDIPNCHVLDHPADRSRAPSRLREADRRTRAIGIGLFEGLRVHRDGRRVDWLRIVRSLEGFHRRGPCVEIRYPTSRRQPILRNPSFVRSCP